jgi:hypothetical protein
MGAERRRIVFRYGFGDEVYLVDSRVAYVVQGYSYTAWATTADEADVNDNQYMRGGAEGEVRREQRTYLLKPPNARAFWIEERHILGAPSAEAP